ncbi:MAG: tetraacyldisaccharide 4'-kinase [Bacteroidales bacterium]|jgi:tetraacyldisaccharide 4'-kinase|nr:tetraacyldisaccharide 4'-kinase [Bacteroidales bacterium]
MDDRRSIFLYPFSLIYGLITGLRNFFYNAEILKSHEFSIPVICVGNITVGGTGKTPHTEYLAGLLRKDFKVAILSRGYKRKSSGFLFANPASTAEDIGDEPLQMYRKFPEITVAVDSNRVRGVKTILKERPETGVIILDDGFQHRRITPGYSILLSDFERLMIRDHLLPYGNLRESLNNMNRADIILITKSPKNISPIQRRLLVKEVNKRPYQNLYFTTLQYNEPVNVFDGSSPESDILSGSGSENCGVVLVTGIANPKTLTDHLQKKFTEFIHLPFEDHHTFTIKDMQKIVDAWTSLKCTRKYILTTEKDAVRLREFTNIAEQIRSSFFYVPLKIEFLNDDRAEFDNMIIDYVRKNKRNNRVSQN